MTRGALGLIVSAFAPPVRRRGGRCRTALEAVAHIATTMRPREAACAWRASSDAARILEWVRTEHRGAVVPLTFGTTPARFSGSQASHRLGERHAA